VTLLDRHLFKSVLFTCAAAVGLFAFVMMLAAIKGDLLVPLLTGRLGYGVAAQLLLMLPLTVAPFALPMGLLTGVLLTLGRLSADSEIIAMRAAGLGLARIARPILVLGVLGGVACLFTNFYAFPKAKAKYERDLTAALRRDPLSFIVPRTFIRDFKGCVIYVGDVSGTVLRDIWTWELDAQQRTKRFSRADSGRIEFDEAQNTLLLTMSVAKVEDRAAAAPERFVDQAPMVATSGTLPVVLPLDRFFGREAGKVKPEWFTYAQLDAERARLAAQPVEPGREKEAAVRRMKLAIVVHDKFNLALAAFAFALVAVPLGIRVSRRETSANLGVALLLVMGFYLLTVAVKSLDRHPEYRPDLLLWLPNALFLGIGAWLFRRLER
jgi:lipopolysaccharide export system permease protein